MNRIDLIIDALEQYVNVVVSHNDPNNFRVRVKDGGEPARKALAAARELRELKPVAYMDRRGILFNWTTHPHWNTALYALDEVKHEDAPLP